MVGILKVFTVSPAQGCGHKRFTVRIIGTQEIPDSLGSDQALDLIFFKLTIVGIFSLSCGASIFIFEKF